MRAPCAVMLALLALVTPSRMVSGPNPQLKITIKGAGLTRPIEITDKYMLVQFFFGNGPGNYSSSGHNYWAEPSFIVDWTRGTAPEPPQGLPTYDVEFLTSRPDMNTYRVTYVTDPATQQGFVYLPAKTDPRYRENAWLILRGIEGNWFHAWSAWDAAVKPLLANAR